MPNPSHHWLVILPSRLGDAVLSTPVLRFLQDRYATTTSDFAGLFLTLGVSPITKDLFADCPYAHETIIIHKKRLSYHWLKLWTKTIARQWQGVIDLRGSALSYGLYTKNRIIWRKQFSSHKPNTLPAQHKVEQINALLTSCIGNKEEGDHCQSLGSQPFYNPMIWINQLRQDTVDLALNNQPVLSVAPAANWLGKQWPKESFIKLIKHFYDEFPMARVLLWCSPQEQDYVQGILQKLPPSCEAPQAQDSSLYNIANVATYLARSQVFIGNDSGLMHLSAAVGTPTIGLFGPSDEQVYGPWDCRGERQITIRSSLSPGQTQALPGFSYKSRDQCYMHDLSVDQVWSTLRKTWVKAVNKDQ